jgi:hypothetical protein
MSCVREQSCRSLATKKAYNFEKEHEKSRILNSKLSNSPINFDAKLKDLELRIASLEAIYHDKGGPLTPKAFMEINQVI